MVPSVSVRVRDLDVSGAGEDSMAFPPEDVPVERAVRHPHYSRTTRGLTSDIGLLRLQKELVFSSEQLFISMMLVALPLQIDCLLYA